MSLMTREDMLRELELLPTWQLRTPLKVPETPISQADEVMTSVIPVVAVSAITAPVATDPAPQFAVTEPFARLEPAETAKNPVLLYETGLSDTRPVDVNLLSVRSKQITQMDLQSLQQCVQSCQACSLSHTRTQTVFGVGDANADWLFIGEAPGVEEDRQGEPFVGQAGKLLDNMLAAIQLRRGQNVYIANVLKCHPPENREPHSEEVAQCELYLKRQIELIQPKIIIALGKVAAQTLLKSEDTVSSMRGQLHEYHHVPVIVTYHPAYLLRNQADKVKTWEDLCFAKDTVQNL